MVYFLAGTQVWWSSLGKLETNILITFLERRDGRKISPILSATDWDTRLRKRSFTGVDLVMNDNEGPAQQMSLMISRPVSAQLGPKTICLVTDPNCSNNHLALSQKLSQHLEQQSCQVIFQYLPLSDITEDSTYVILDDSDEPMLQSSASEVMGKVIELLSRGRKILWIAISSRAGASKNKYRVLTHIARANHVAHPDLNLLTLDVHSYHNLADLGEKVFGILDASLGDASRISSKESEYIYSEGTVLISRLKPSSSVKKWLRKASVQPASILPSEGIVKSSTAHTESLEMTVDSQARKPCNVKIEVRASSENLDHQPAKWSKSIKEYAGLVVSVGSGVHDHFHTGDRVCGWDDNSLSVYTQIDENKLYHLPESISFNSGASIVGSFTSAYYGLVDSANLREGQTILIHGATEFLGQAAIQIAQSVGTKIITTAGAQREILTEMYAVSEDCVISDKSLDFPTRVRDLTEG